MKRILCVVFALTATADALAAEVPVFENGKALCEIVVPEKAKDKELAAAELLRDVFRKMGSVEIPIVRRRSGPASAICIGGDGAPAVAEIPENADQDSFAIVHDGDNAVSISGKSPSGTFYGVCEFLERYADVMWVWPGDTGTVIPKLSVFRPDVGKTVSVPAFGMRRLSGVESGFCGFLRMQTQEMGELRGQYSHNCRKVIPWSMWETHPEYFNLHKGVRVKPERMKNQLCTSNPEVRRIFVEAAKSMFRKWPNLFTFSVAQNDGGLEFFCECSDCRALDVPGVAGISDRYFDFANAVADGIRDEFPDRGIATLAYGDATFDPPVKTKLRDNVVPCVVVPSMKDPVKSVEAWAQASKMLYAYFHLHGKQAPKFYPKSFKRYLQFLKRNKVIGICGELHPATQRLEGSWEIDGPRSWIIMKLIWNPDADVDGLMTRFCRLFYGPAAKPMRDYYARLEEAWNRLSDPYDFRVDYDSNKAGYDLYSDDDLRYFEDCIKEARRLAARSPECLARIDALDCKLSKFIAAARNYRYWKNNPDAGSAVGGNILKNPGFESIRKKYRKAGVPAEQLPFKAAVWNKWIGAFKPGDVDVCETVSFEGRKSLVFSGTPKAASGQTVKLNPSGNYRLTAMVCGTAGKAASININFRGKNGKWLHKSTFFDQSVLLAGCGEWKKVSLVFTVPEDVTSGVVHCAVSGLEPDERIYYDAVSLVEIKR